MIPTRSHLTSQKSGDSAVSIRKMITDFQHVMGNQLTILSMTYKKCVDVNSYPSSEIRTMQVCAGRVYSAIRKFRKQRATGRAYA